MTTAPIVELDARFSSPGAAARPWEEVLEVIDRSEIFWLSTVRRDGRPHVTPLPAVWLDDALHFCTGAEEQKARNLALDPRCVLTTGSNTLRSGLDVVIEGTAVRVVDDERLGQLAGLWRDQLDWPFDVVDGAFRDPDRAAGASDDGAGVALVFAVAPSKILAFGKGEPFSQTRITFAAG